MKNKFSINAAAQRQRLLHHLQSNGASTTLEIRQLLDILSPASRIYELRHYDKYNIQLYWVYQLTDAGVRHRVGKYVLQSGHWETNIRRIGKGDCQ